MKWFTKLRQRRQDRKDTRLLVRAMNGEKIPGVIVCTPCPDGGFHCEMIEKD